LQIVKSKNTGKIRNVLVDGKHVVSMRAPDGLFTLRPDGARKVADTASGYRRLRRRSQMANPMPTTAAYMKTWYFIAISKKLSGTGTHSIGTSRPASIRLS
jgi:hypothetical protein